MPEHDAFGRPVGEDPLAGLGWTSPRPAPEPPSAPPPAAKPPRKRRRGGAGTVVALAVAGAAALAAGSGSHEAAKVARPSVGVAPPQPAHPEAAVALTRPAALRRGLRILERDVPGRIQSLRVEDARIDVTVGLSGGRLRIAQYQAGAEAARVFTTTGGGFSTDGLVSYESVDPRAPDHLIRAANRRLGKRRSDVNYLVLLQLGDEPGWSLFYKDGKMARGDRRGRLTG